MVVTLAEQQATETKKDKRGIYGGYGGYGGYSSYAAPALSVVTKEVPVPVPHPVAVPVEKHVPVPVKVKIVLPFHAKKKKKEKKKKICLGNDAFRFQFWTCFQLSEKPFFRAGLNLPVVANHCCFRCNRIFGTGIIISRWSNFTSIRSFRRV